MDQRGTTFPRFENKQEKVVPFVEARESRAFLEKIGLLAISDVNDQDVLAPQAPAQTARLFPSHGDDDDTIVVVANEFHDSLTEKSADFTEQLPLVWIHNQEL